MAISGQNLQACFIPNPERSAQKLCISGKSVDDIKKESSYKRMVSLGLTPIFSVGTQVVAQGPTSASTGFKTDWINVSEEEAKNFVPVPPSQNVTQTSGYQVYQQRQQEPIGYTPTSTTNTPSTTNTQTTSPSTINTPTTPATPQVNQPTQVSVPKSSIQAASDIAKNMNEYVAGRDYNKQYQSYIDALEKQSGKRITKEDISSFSAGKYDTLFSNNQNDGQGGPGDTFIAHPGQVVRNKNTGETQTITVPSQFLSSAFEIIQTQIQQTPAQTQQIQAPTSNNQTIGADRVDYLFNLYLNRPANDTEKRMYGGHMDDSILVRDLTTTQKKIQETQAKQQQQYQSTWDGSENADFKVLDDYPLVKFTNDPTPGDDSSNAATVFLYDKNTKTYYPFLSITAMEKYFGLPFSDLQGRIEQMPTSVLNNETWNGNFLPASQGINNNGIVAATGTKDLLPPQQQQQQQEPTITGIYGQQRMGQEVETNAASLLSTVFTQLKKSGDISQETFNSYLNNPSELAGYVSAMLYGGYTMGDIYRDIKIREMAAAGNSQYADKRGISLTMEADQFYNTDEGRNVKLDTNITIPQELNGLSSDLFKYKLFQIPDEAFSTLVQPIDVNSPEFKAEAEKIQAAWYDITMQRASAETEQAKAIADSNWEIFKKDINRKYGIALSDSANTAWGQLQQLFSGATSQGLQGSGIVSEAMDRYLRDVRKADERMRIDKMETEELEMRNKLLKTGSPAEIADFIAKNPEKAVSWGLVPSDETKQYFSLSNLKNIYPDLSDSEIQLVHDMILDENGNYRSDLYRTMYSNKYDLTQEKKTYQETKLLENKLREEEKAYAPYTTSSNPFSSYAAEYETKVPESIQQKYGDIVQPQTQQPQQQTQTPTVKWGDYLTSQSGQRISPQDPNYAVYAKQQGLYAPGTSTTTIPTYSAPQPTTTTQTPKITTGAEMVTLKDSASGLELKMNRDASYNYLNKPNSTWSVI